MSDESHKRGGIFWAVILAAFLPVLYILSFGPMVRMAPPTRTAWRSLKAFYYPVFWAHDNTPLSGPLEWYTGLWQSLGR
jgi:hypothetical protein